jgi:8-oxo-dGTP diphosphatase
MYKRKRGTALVDTENGILIVSGRHKVFILPGGGTDRGESRRKAAIRELKEETGMNCIDAEFLFEYVGYSNKSHQGGMFQDHHKVFLIKANGTPKPHHEVKYVEYYKEGSNIRITKQTAEIIKKYNKIKKEPENKKPFWKFW